MDSPQPGISLGDIPRCARDDTEKKTFQDTANEQDGTFRAGMFSGIFVARWMRRGEPVARKCPQCSTSIPASATAAYSDALECPGCKAPLELSSAPRYAATTLGLAAGATAAWVTRDNAAAAGWVVPLLAGFVSYGVVAALATMLLSAVRLRTAEPVAAHSSNPDHGPAHP